MESLSSRLYRIKLDAEGLDTKVSDPDLRVAVLELRQDIEDLETEAKLLEINPGIPRFDDWKPRRLEK